MGDDNEIKEWKKKKNEKQGIGSKERIPMQGNKKLTKDSFIDTVSKENNLDIVGSDKRFEDEPTIEDYDPDNDTIDTITSDAVWIKKGTGGFKRIQCTPEQIDYFAGKFDSELEAIGDTLEKEEEYDIPEELEDFDRRIKYENGKKMFPIVEYGEYCVTIYNPITKKMKDVKYIDIEWSDDGEHALLTILEEKRIFDEEGKSEFKERYDAKTFFDDTIYVWDRKEQINTYVTYDEYNRANCTNITCPADTLASPAGGLINESNVEEEIFNLIEKLETGEKMDVILKSIAVIQEFLVTKYTNLQHTYRTNKEDYLVMVGLMQAAHDTIEKVKKELSSPTGRGD